MYVQRRGITLVEVLVVVGIVGALAAMIAPAVMMARHAARRMECGSRIRQLGVAFHNYHSTFNCLPYSTTSTGPATWSVWRSVLPELQLQSLETEAQRVDRDLSDGRSTDETQPERRVVVPVLRCPADGGAGSFGANFGINWSGSGQKTPDGAFTGDERLVVGFHSITDGTSNTALVSEFLRGDADPMQPSEGVRSDARRRIFNVLPGIDDQSKISMLQDRCRNIDPATGPFVEAGRGRFWLSGNYYHYSYNHFELPNRLSCVNSGGAFGLILAPSSLHGTGVNVLFADGSVRFVSDQLDLQVWRAQGTRAGGEALQ